MKSKEVPEGQNIKQNMRPYIQWIYKMCVITHFKGVSLFSLTACVCIEKEWGGFYEINPVV